MEGVKMVECITCSECAKLFETLDRKGKADLKAERSKLERCKPCERIKKEEH